MLVPSPPGQLQALPEVWVPAILDCLLFLGLSLFLGLGLGLGLFLSLLSLRLLLCLLVGRCLRLLLCLRLFLCLPHLPHAQVVCVQCSHSVCCRAGSPKPASRPASMPVEPAAPLCRRSARRVSARRPFLCPLPPPSTQRRSRLPAHTRTWTRAGERTWIRTRAHSRAHTHRARALSVCLSPPPRAAPNSPLLLHMCFSAATLTALQTISSPRSVLVTPRF
eukprot:COSAG03_NODE_234_length_10215_cov_4.583037_2_plen_221_part_00